MGYGSIPVETVAAAATRPPRRRQVLVAVGVTALVAAGALATLAAISHDAAHRGVLMGEFGGDTGPSSRLEKSDLKIGSPRNAKVTPQPIRTEG